MKESESLEMIAEPLMKEPGSLNATERPLPADFHWN